MTLQNVHHIEADIKRKTYLTEPHVTANDDIAFIVSITDDGAAIDMASVTTAYLASTRLDKETVITVGTKLQDGTIKFELGHTETQVVGEVKAVAQLFDAEGDRISSVAWTYVVDRDPTGEGYIPTEKDKTFIEVVLVEGPAVIQEAKDVTAAAQQSVVNADGATERANTAAGGAESVVNEFSTFKSSAAKAKEFPTVDDRFEELERDGYVPVTNFIENGDFKEGLTGWTNQGSASVNTVIKLIGNQSIKRTASDGDTYKDITGINGDVIYASVFANIVSASKDFILRAADFGSGSLNGVTKSFGFAPTNGWVRNSLVKTIQNNGIRILFGSYHSGQSAEAYFDGVLALNLTRIFGAGNEPTVEQMDSLLTQYPSSWFDGTVNLAENKKLVTFLLNQLQKKADREQEAWIAPVLLSGWTEVTGHPVRYMKDQFGFVHVKGRVTGGTIGAVVFTFPVGYRTTSQRNFLLTDENETNFVRGLTGSSGSVIIRTSSTGYVELANITYKAET